MQKWVYKQPSTNSLTYLSSYKHLSKVLILDRIHLTIMIFGFENRLLSPRKFNFYFSCHSTSIVLIFNVTKSCKLNIDLKSETPEHTIYANLLKISISELHIAAINVNNLGIFFSGYK